VRDFRLRHHVREGFSRRGSANDFRDEHILWFSSEKRF
jgi:hypothetical protein